MGETMQEEPSEEIYSTWKPPSLEQKPAEEKPVEKKESEKATETPPEKKTSPAAEPPRRQSVDETLREIRYAQTEIRQHRAGRDVALASSERGGDPGDPGDPHKEKDEKDPKKTGAIPPAPRRTPSSQMTLARGVPPPPSRRPLPERAPAQAPQTPQRPPDSYKGFWGGLRAIRDTLKDMTK